MMGSISVTTEDEKASATLTTIVSKEGDRTLVQGVFISNASDNPVVLMIDGRDVMSVQPNETLTFSEPFVSIPSGGEVKLVERPVRNQDRFILSDGTYEYSQDNNGIYINTNSGDSITVAGNIITDSDNTTTSGALTTEATHYYSDEDGFVVTRFVRDGCVYKEIRQDKVTYTAVETIFDPPYPWTPDGPVKDINDPDVPEKTRKELLDVIGGTSRAKALKKKMKWSDNEGPTQGD